jgi:hypothetical protein
MNKDWVNIVFFINPPVAQKRECLVLKSRQNLLNPYKGI